jgi:hypothetical protein
MRSLVSKIEEQRESRISLGYYGDTLAFDAAIIVPVEAADDALIEQERRAQCAELLASLSTDDSKAEAVIDGRCLGLRGEELARFAEIGQAELATVQRRIKRRAADLMHALDALDQAA